MQKLKKLIPASLKLKYSINKRWFKDQLSGNNKKFACQPAADHRFLPFITIEQAIKSNESTANKIHNLSLSINKLNHISILPGSIFSFWHLVGNPSQKNGFKKSRSIIGNLLQEEVGGGLCQLSGLIYFLALHAGITITERHSHSLDIYQEVERFTPLGSDATVVYGYKDLRFVNNLQFPVCFSFTITDHLLTGIFSATEKPALCEIEFEYKKYPAFTQVTTNRIKNGESSNIANNNYSLPG